jgi:FAD/FMN-containing dehydrogenase
MLWVFKHIHRRKPHWRGRLLNLIKNMVPDFAEVQPAHLAYATARLVKHQEVEYALPLERAEQVLSDLDRAMHARRVQTLIPIEVRSTRRDDIFLSPCYGRDTVFVAVHSFQDECNLEYFHMADEIFRSHGGRPHWGKLHYIAPSELPRLYPRWEDFSRVRRALDPEGVFENGWLRRIFAAGLCGQKLGDLGDAVSYRGTADVHATSWREP